jgi:hypothetical protein
MLLGLLSVLAGGLVGRPARADTIFLEDGRTIQADRVEVRGDRVRIERDGQETIDLPKSRVLSVHSPRPAPAPVPSPPAVYPNFVQEMTDRVRGQLNAGPNAAPGAR